MVCDICGPDLKEIVNAGDVDLNEIGGFLKGFDFEAGFWDYGLEAGRFERGIKNKEYFIKKIDRLGNILEYKAGVSLDNVVNFIENYLFSNKFVNYAEGSYKMESEVDDYVITTSDAGKDFPTEVRDMGQEGLLLPEFDDSRNLKDAIQYHFRVADFLKTPPESMEKLYEKDLDAEIDY